MAKKVVLDPVTRIEGHLRIDTSVEGGRVVEAWCKGEMFRGFEALLVNRDPFDAPIITQRICGVCPVSHAIASVKTIESALGVKPTSNGRVLRNLVLGANYLQSHVLHFYHLSALDFVNVEDILSYQGKDPVLNEIKDWVGHELKFNKILPAAPFLPKLPGKYPAGSSWNLNALAHYLEALEIRQEAHRMLAIFGGKMPHTASLVPGGVTCGVDPEMVENFRGRLKKIQRFVDTVYIPDVLAAAELFPAYANIGQGVKRYLSYGAFDESSQPWPAAGTYENGVYQKLDTSKINEEVAASRYADSGALHPSIGEIKPQPGKNGAYSWLKAPRYNGKPYEVGPLARLMVAYGAGDNQIKEAVHGLLKVTGLSAEQLPSVLGRHAARALEASLVAKKMEKWLDELRPGEPSVTEYTPRSEGKGEGLTEAPRGALGHWITIKNSKIARYQCVVPSTWNFSPRDSRGNAGPVEEALLGTPVESESKGLVVARVVRSFDPCIACAVH